MNSQVRITSNWDVMSDDRKKQIREKYCNIIANSLLNELKRGSNEPAKIADVKEKAVI